MFRLSGCRTSKSKELSGLGWHLGVGMLPPLYEQSEIGIIVPLITISIGGTSQLRWLMLGLLGRPLRPW